MQTQVTVDIHWLHEGFGSMKFNLHLRSELPSTSLISKP